MARIVVVDDNKDARDVFAELLKLRGHEVMTARDADGADVAIRKPIEPNELFAAVERLTGGRMDD